MLSCEELVQMEQDAALDNAQKAYSTRLPKEEECRYCGGEGRVIVASFLDADGKEHAWPADYAPEGPEIACPCCYESDRERNRRAKR
jgi:hypothetical protein